jgi:hypothetical protein
MILRIVRLEGCAQWRAVKQEHVHRLERALNSLNHAEPTAQDANHGQRTKSRQPRAKKAEVKKAGDWPYAIDPVAEGYHAPEQPA